MQDGKKAFYKYLDLPKEDLKLIHFVRLIKILMLNDKKADSAGYGKLHK